MKAQAEAIYPHIMCVIFALSLKKPVKQMKTKIQKRAYPPWSRFCVKLLIRQNEHPLRYRKTGNAEMDLFFYFCSTAHCSYAEYRMAFVFSSIHVAAAAHVV